MKIELADRASRMRFQSGTDVEQVIVGNADDCDLWLPRPQYPELGRKELRIVAEPGGATIIGLQAAHSVTLAGKPLTAEAKVTFGTYHLVINGRHFDLIITP